MKNLSLGQMLTWTLYFIHEMPPLKQWGLRPVNRQTHLICSLTLQETVAQLAAAKIIVLWQRPVCALSDLCISKPLDVV